MRLKTYQRKRDFKYTPEPAGKIKRSDPDQLAYVIQKHDARRLHYDFRLEFNGVLLSWAIPKGPSLDPTEKRMAVRTEDHPLDYGDFEGIIPKGQYGGGTVLLWDQGRWEPEGNAAAMLKKGHLTFMLHGERLQGRFHLVKLKSQQEQDAWLLIKGADDYAHNAKKPVVDRYKTSVQSGRTLKQIERAPASQWDSNKSKSKKLEKPKTKSFSAAELLSLPGARKGEIPWPLEPQLPTLIHKPVEGDHWLHELKLDGYRVLLRIQGGHVSLFTRSGLNWTEKLQPVATMATQALTVDDAVIDCELVAMDARGRTSFGALQRAIKQGAQNLHLFAFDLLQAHGVDLRELPLLQRKQILQRMIPPGRNKIRYNEHIIERGDRVWEQACQLEAEGIVSKRIDAPYRSGRGRDWVKVKCLGREEFIVGGYITRKANPLASLLVGRSEHGKLVYVGRVGTGFKQDDMQELLKRLRPLEQTEMPFSGEHPPPRGDKIHWVTPKLLVEIRYSDITDDGILRHASFQGIREDKPAMQTFEFDTLPDIRISNADKVLFPEIDLTKGQIAAWIALMAPWILPHIADRPLMLLRCPNGRSGHCFFQKHDEKAPSPIRQITVPDDDEPYLAIDDINGLLTLVQMGTLEVHPWGAKTDRLDRPDRMIFDLDPDEAVPFEEVIAAAHDMRRRLENFGLESWPRWTGGKGLHVVVPLLRRNDWEDVRSFSRTLANRISVEEPKRFIATASKQKRKNKIFIDWLRNGAGATAIASWWFRARENAPVAAPLRWSDLTPDIDLTQYRVPILQPPERDPWEGFFECRQTITAKMKKQVGIK